MEGGQDVVHVQILDEEDDDVVFDGLVSSDVLPNELLHLRCLYEQSFCEVFNHATKALVTSLKGFKSIVLSSRFDLFGEISFTGVVYKGLDGVVRSSKSVPSCECKTMSVWKLSSHEECEKVFHCETLEELDLNHCKLRQMPQEIGKMKMLKILFLESLTELTSIPEEIGELSSLKVLRISSCRIKNLPKRMKDLTSLQEIRLVGLALLQFSSDDLSLSKLKKIRISSCQAILSNESSVEAVFAIMRMSVTLRSFSWYENHQSTNELILKALRENGSITEAVGKFDSSDLVNRNKSNHNKALHIVLCLLAIKRCKRGLMDFPREMVQMIAQMLWITRCDLDAWSEKKTQ